MDSSTLRGGIRRLVVQYDTVPIFKVGRMIYTRSEAIHTLGCANWRAFRILEGLLKKLGVKTAKQLYEQDPHRLHARDGIGDVTLYCAMAILEAEGLDPADWWGWQEKEQARARKPWKEAQAEMAAARVH